MRKYLRLRAWASPLTTATFAVVAGTGMLMFFHLSFGSMHAIHEWLGCLFVVGALAHVVVNWKPLVRHLRSPVGIGILAVVCLLGALSLVPAAGGRRHGPPSSTALTALEQSPLTLVAQVTKRSPEDAVAALESQGIQVRHEAQTITEIASDNGRRSAEILAYITGDAIDSVRGRSQR